ncbi:MAG TPA: Crp/Fnr family transcriptional regulator [Bacteroidia bacterium]|nr:Crp/Fnr family transcriptional regulator [Bacteroidia bacterium]
MPTHLFLDHIRSYTEVSDEEFAEFLAYFKHFTVPKNETFYRAGEVPRYSPFILKGCFRQYISNSDGTEQTILLIEEGTFAGQVGSMRTNTPTNVTLQALEDSEVLGITIANADLCLDKFPFYKIFFGKKFPSDHARLMEEALRLKTETPEALYKELVEKRPSLIQRVPQHILANYLGVRTETISRIRAKIARG